MDKERRKGEDIIVITLLTYNILELPTQNRYTLFSL